jgi:hypothetical protein
MMEPPGAQGGKHLPSRNDASVDPADYVSGFFHTDTCSALALVNGSRFRPLHSRNRMPASSAIKSSSEGHTNRRDCPPD